MLSLIQALDFSLQHTLSLLSLLCLRQPLPGNIATITSAYDLTSCRLPHKQLNQLSIATHGFLAMTVHSLALIGCQQVKVELRPTVSRPVSLGVKPYVGPKTRFLLLSDSCGFVDVGRPLWGEDRSVIYRCHSQKYTPSTRTILHVGILHSESVVKIPVPCGYVR
jgi:hypothetical protein